MSTNRTTKNSKIIDAAPEILYQAFTDPEALAVWLAPGEMTGKIRDFDLKEGGGYQMSLYYPESEKESRGKTSNLEDRFSSKFVLLIPNRRIVQAITFDTLDPDFSGEMKMEITFESVGFGTRVTISFENIPSGIRLEDNETGTEQSLEKLARYVIGLNDK